MKKIISIIFILFCLNIYAQKSVKEYKTLIFYSFGMPSRIWQGTEEQDLLIGCENELMEKYGFDYEVKAGCVVSEKLSEKWKKHNERMERKMIKRHGEGWRERYEAEVSACSQGN